MLPARKVNIISIINDVDHRISQVDGLVSDLDTALLNIESCTSLLGSSGIQHSDPDFTEKFNTQKIKNTIRSTAWRYLYMELKIHLLFTREEAKSFERNFTGSHDIPDFNIDNVMSVFGKYIENPRMSILKTLAYEFSQLDPSYMSHNKVKIGTDGLPKKIIFKNVVDFHKSTQHEIGMNWHINDHAIERILPVLNALRTMQEKPLLNFLHVRHMIKDLDFVSSSNLEKVDNSVININNSQEKHGYVFKIFKNGNAHIVFNKKDLEDINRGLAEFYGDVLPDAEDLDAKETRKSGKKYSSSTEISKDLQFYPTSEEVADIVARKVQSKQDMQGIQGMKILEPSAGEGALMQALKRKNPSFDVIGYEYEHARVRKCQENGLSVFQHNFLELPESPEFDYVVMNPPFYGKHYLLHIEHAKKFLKPNGKLISILPASSWYDHDVISNHPHTTWEDLPMRSFSHCGVNVNTGIMEFTNM